ncbi:MAG: hypothetical protein HLX48_07210, partial [Halomonas sp.]|nr:hypothetical protein [Halomonas sp.]
VVMLIAALFMIYGGIVTDIAGLAVGIGMVLMQRKLHGKGGGGSTATT